MKCPGMSSVGGRFIAETCRSVQGYIRLLILLCAYIGLCECLLSSETLVYSKPYTLAKISLNTSYPLHLGLSTLLFFFKCARQIDVYLLHISYVDMSDPQHPP